MRSYYKGGGGCFSGTGSVDTNVIAPIRLDLDQDGHKVIACFCCYCYCRCCC